MKKKIIFVTGLVAVMLIAICVCLFRLYMPGFFTVAALLAVYGFFSAAHDFQCWLAKDAPESEELPPVGFSDEEQEQEPPKKRKKPTIIFEDPENRDDPTIIDADFTEVPDYTSFRRYAV